MTGHSQPADRITPARLFGEPPLSAAVPQRPTYVPAGADGEQPCVLFLMPRADAVQVLDLWRCDIAQPLSQTPAGTLWLQDEDLHDLTGDANATESEAERAERERLRQFAGGITQFQVRPDHRSVLVVVRGQGILVDLDTRATKRLTASAARHSGFTFSPLGRYLSYVRDGDLYALDIDTGQEQRLTEDASHTVFSGLPDFIAQEEMHRFSGHWWHPDESRIALQRTDEAPVPLTYRHDIKADTIDVIEQRYPYAGGRNADVRLGICTLATGATEWLTYQQEPDDYLARVDWMGDALLVQTQRRNQQQLTLLRFETGHSVGDRLHQESSSTWINLHDNLLALDDATLCWTSEAEGLPRLLVADVTSGAEPLSLQPMTDPDLHVSTVHRFAGERLWFSGWRDTPTELHLYCCARSANGWQAPQQCTTSAGWHQSLVADDASIIIDLHSALDQPPTLSLLDVETNARCDVAGGNIDSAHPYHPYLASHCTPTLGTVSAADGTELHYRLTRPSQASAAQPAAAILYVYGGPGGARVRNEWSPLLLQMFADAGYAVFELDNRGTGNRGRDFDDPLYQAMGTVEVDDQLAGVTWLRQQDWIDSSRIGVFGHSYGGYMTLKCLLAAPAVFAAGVSVAPVTDWALYDTHYTERYLGHPGDSPGVYAAAGLLGHCSTLQRPLLLMHGMADDNVLFANTTALIAELQQAALPFELMTYPGSKHALQEPWVSTHRFDLLLDFFARRLQQP